MLFMQLGGVMTTIKTKKNTRRVTLVDVAEKVGVSAITVSRCINNPAIVSEELRERIQSAIDALGYIPNQFASSLASARSRVIGVTIPSLTNTVFTDVLLGINQVFDAAGFNVLIADTQYSVAHEEKMIRTFLSQSPEGLIITGGDQSPRLRDLISRSKVPVVQIMELVEKPIDMNVGFSHYQAGVDVARHLIFLGHTRIGFMGARMDPRVQQRLQGFKDELLRKRLFDESRVVATHDPSSIGLGGELLKQLLQQSQKNLDAVFCANDDLALGALFQAQRLKIRIPEKLAICGFNDIDAAAFVNPSLTSVSVGRFDMGVSAATLILRAINQESIKQKIIATPYQINVRESTHQP